MKVALEMVAGLEFRAEDSSFFVTSPILAVVVLLASTNKL